MAHTGAQLQKIEDDRNMTVADKQAQVFLLMKGLFGKNFRDTAEG
jgi:hypothetical protein